jgi:hypothetical protein
MKDNTGLLTASQNVWKSYWVEVSGKDNGRMWSEIDFKHQKERRQLKKNADETTNSVHTDSIHL